MSIDDAAEKGTRLHGHGMLVQQLGQILTPEQENESLKRRLAAWEDEHRMEQIRIRRDLVSQLIGPSMVDGLFGAEDDVITCAEKLAQYILNGKPAEPMLVVSDAPMVPLDDIQKFIDGKYIYLDCGALADIPNSVKVGYHKALTALAKEFGLQIPQ